MGTTTVDSDGNYSFTPPSDLSDAVHDVSAEAIDASGNISSASSANEFTVYSIGLLRYGGVTQCKPQNPPNSSIFPLYAGRDLEKPNYTSASSWSDETSDLNSSSPCLIFYQLQGYSGNTPKAAKNSGKIVITY